MATLTLEQLKKKHPNAQPKVMSLAQIERQNAMLQQTRGNQFEQQPNSFLGKARDFATSIIGGGKVAEGAGLSIAAPRIQEQLSQTEQQGSDLELALQKKIIEKRNAGQDTTRLQSALDDLRADQQVTRDVQTDFVENLPSSKQVIGSAARLGGTLAGGALVGGVTRGTIGYQGLRAGQTVGGLNKAFALGKATTFGGGALRGAGIGATGGAIEGAIQGAGIGAEQDKDFGGIARSAAGSAVTGAAIGAPLGAIGGGITGRMQGNQSQETLLSKITPEAKELTETEYEKLVAQGRIQPKTATQPARYILSEGERNTALKYADVIDDDPVKTVLNIKNKFSEIDDEVGDFLRKNNGVFSKGELRNAINSKFDEIDDITLDPTRLENAKTKLVDRFVKSLETNDMESLWIARKNYDQEIQKAFSGSPTLQKQVQRGLRDAVQDYIANRTPNEVYSTYMRDMSNLFQLRDTVANKAAKERALSALSKWAKENPKKASAIGWSVTAGATLGLAELFGVNPLTRGSASSGG